MAQYVEVPKDFDEIKRKFAIGLTKRQLICFGIALGVGSAAFYLAYFKLNLGVTGSAECLFLAAAPIAIFGVYHVNGMFLEEKLKLMYKFHKSTKIKTYQTENIFEKIEKALEYRKLKRTITAYERRRK